jgi:SAM-dependent methyltransferase
MQDLIKAILSGERVGLYDPTPPEVIERMLELAALKEGDLLYDLGSGDGRVVITAAKKYGVKAVGIEADPVWIQASREKVTSEGVADRVTITGADLFQVDLSPPDVITIYLLPRLNVRLMPQLERLRPGTRIVSHRHDMQGAKPKATLEVRTDDGDVHTLYLWVVPWEKEEVREDQDCEPEPNSSGFQGPS